MGPSIHPDVFTMDDRAVVKAKLHSGELKVEPAKGKKSVVWRSFNVVVTSESKPTGFVQCKFCPHLLKCTESTGTSAMLRHECPSKDFPVRTSISN